MMYDDLRWHMWIIWCMMCELWFMIPYVNYVMMYEQCNRPDKKNIYMRPSTRLKTSAIMFSHDPRALLNFGGHHNNRPWPSAKPPTRKKTKKNVREFEEETDNALAKPNHMKSTSKPLVYTTKTIPKTFTYTRDRFQHCLHVVHRWGRKTERWVFGPF